MVIVRLVSGLVVDTVAAEPLSQISRDRRYAAGRLALNGPRTITVTITVAIIVTTTEAGRESECCIQEVSLQKQTVETVTCRRYFATTCLVG